jgi:hypothetical protein
VPEDAAMSQSNWKLKLLPGHFVFLAPFNEQTKRGVILLVEFTNSDYKGETGLLQYNRGKEEPVFYTFLGYVSETPCPVTEIYGNLPNPIQTGIMTQSL